MKGDKKMKIFYDITKRCNANCIYCFTNSINTTELDNELSDEELNSLVNKLVQLNVDSLSIGGGEPMLRDVSQLINKFGKKINISLTTNGMIMDQNFINEMIANETVKLTISLDSIDPLINEIVRSGIDTHKVIKNIKKLTHIDSIRKRLSIRSTISIYNIDKIYELINFCNQLKIEKLKINSTNPFGRATSSIHIIPDFHDFMSKLEEVEKYCLNENLYTKVELPIKKYLKADNVCTLGNNSLYINSFGECYPCAFSEGKLSLGNIRTDCISQIIDKSKDFSHDNDICSKCEINRYKEY